MKWIGLTGGIASGKSTVSRFFREAGLPVVDADELARDVVAPGSSGLQQIVEKFGAEFLKQDGSLDRQKLGKEVFGKPQKLMLLESILHPLIQNETARRKQEFEKAGQAFAFYDVPLLFEKKLQKNFDAIIVVSAHEDLQKQRMKSRDGLSEEDIRSRLSAQIPLAEKISEATWVIHNEGSLDDLKKATFEVLQKIQSGKA